MRFHLAAAALFSSVLSVLAADHLITVGDNGTLAFNPNNITAAQGDTVTFEFRAKNHSVTQSTFPSPCTPDPTGVSSGFLATANGTTTFAQWTITLQNTSAPMWFYCAQTNPKNHCQSGMVFSINANANKTFAQYLVNAMNDVSVVNATSPTANGTTPGSSTSAAVAGASSLPSSGAASSSISAGTMTTSLGSVATNAVPNAATALSGAAVTGAANSSSPAGSSAMRLGTSTASGLLVAGLVAGLML